MEFVADHILVLHEGNGSSSDGNKYKRDAKPQIFEDRERKRLVVQVCKLRINTDTGSGTQYWYNAAIPAKENRRISHGTDKKKKDITTHTREHS